MATIKLTSKNAMYCASVPSQRSIRCNFDGPDKGTGWLHGQQRFDARVSIPGTDVQGVVTVGDTSMVWRRHGNGEGFDKLFSYLQGKLDQDVTVTVERISA
jgi:hypothetical protein